jgi:hypothetical protein
MINKGGLQIQKLLIAAMKVQQASDGLWYVYYTFNGVEWLQDTVDSFPDPVTAQTALNTFAATLP